MDFITLVLFALALNMDALGAGTVYGLRNIRLPFISVLIISCMSAAAISVSMLAGHTVARYVPEVSAHRLGGILLMAVGVWVLVQSLQDQGKNGSNGEIRNPVMQIHIRSLGLVIKVLREPARADLDRSGVISPAEAILLGVALSMDALAAGFAVSMLGYSTWVTALIVGTGHVLLTYAGLALGRNMVTLSLGRQLSAIPGCILIALGFLKIYP